MCRLSKHLIYPRILASDMPSLALELTVVSPLFMQLNFQKI